MMSSQVRGLGFLLTFCLLLVLLLIEVQRCQKMVTSLCALQRKESTVREQARLHTTSVRHGRAVLLEV